MPTNLRRVGLLFLIDLVILLRKSQAFESKPNIHCREIGKTWDKSTMTAGAKFTLFHKNVGDDLFCNCEAPYPIEWNITGVITHEDMVRIQPPKRDLIKMTFEVGLNIFFKEAEKLAYLPTSTKLICQAVKDKDPNKREYISVFVEGNRPLINTMGDDKPISVRDSMLIPCLTTNPTTPTRLYRKDSPSDRNEKLVENVVYDPVEGFYSKTAEPFNGVYICRKDVFSLTVTAHSMHLMDYHFSPFHHTVHMLTGQTYELHCSSKTKAVELKFKLDDQPHTIKYTTKTDRKKVAEINMVKVANASIVNVMKAACFAEGKELVKEWTLEFIEAPDLYLDNFEGEVDCLYKGSPKTVQTVRCISPMHCDYMKHCLVNETLCNFKKQKQFFGNSEAYCWIERLQKGVECTSVPYSHYNGLAQCTVMGVTKVWEYFVSLDFLRYSNWKDAPERELVRMDEVQEILYANGTSQFVCVASAFLFTDSISFEIEFKDGSHRILATNDALGNVSNPYSENPRKIDEFNVLGVLDIRLPIDTVAIHCLAPWWNSTDVLKTTRKFETRYLIHPVFTTSHDSNAKEVFINEKKNQRLVCPVKGEPQPFYQWTFANKIKQGDVSELFPELKTSIGSRGEGYLDFPNVNTEYTGTFKCVANNSQGLAVQRAFTVDVQDEPFTKTNLVTFIVIFVILILLMLVIAALVIYMRRYNEAKELVRSLTDSEIDEFFEGKPELLNNAQPTSLEAVEFLPYNRDYEILAEDLEYDTSNETNILGSGEFAIVVKGKIISKSLPAAVKISKPSADVTLFKSLLSEVKIMIYISQHDHIVKLIGVCTQGIRNRNIQIATEICELGSLDKFLLKNRRTFVNLMNANQEIDLALLPENNDQITTLDLINFSAQIAKGMEYLAFKSVVHADLATRNVLLTSGKVAKISDFGLSKKLYECNNYVKKSKSPLPWRWMAVESLTTLTFSTQSDIWSYGVTMFEIYTLGDIPFPNEEWNREFLQRLSTGMRMGRPKYSTQEIYSKTVACWEHEPDYRPSFTTLRIFFEDMLKQYIPSKSGNGFVSQPKLPVGYVHSPTLSVSESQSQFMNSDQIGEPISNQPLYNNLMDDEDKNGLQNPSYVNFE